MLFSKNITYFLNHFHNSKTFLVSMVLEINKKEVKRLVQGVEGS